MGEQLCHCGRPLHYSNAKTQALVEAIIQKLGEMINVTVAGRTWRVPRHYIALHTLKGADIEHLGFEEVTRP